MTAPADTGGEAPGPWYRPSLTRQILIGLVLGCLIGWWMSGLPEAGNAAWSARLELVRDIFLNLVKLMIGPLVFASVVQGIAGTGDVRRVGLIGAKTILYFEVVTTAALVVGLLVVNVVGPGVGVRLTGGAAALGAAPQAKPLTFLETLLHIFPTSLMDAMARNDVLQVVTFSVLFAMAVMAAGAAGRPVLEFCGSPTPGMLQVPEILM